MEMDGSDIKDDVDDELIDQILEDSYDESKLKTRAAPEPSKVKWDSKDIDKSRQENTKFKLNLTKKSNRRYRKYAFV